MSIYVYFINNKGYNKKGKFKIQTKAILLSIIAIFEIIFILFYHKFIILFLIIMAGIIISGIFIFTAIKI